MRTLSLDLRQRILQAYLNGEGTRQDIADRFKVSLGMVKKLVQQYRRTGSIQPLPRSGRPPVFDEGMAENLKNYVSEHPEATLQTIRDHFSSQADCSLMTISNTLKRLDIDSKRRRGARRRKHPHTVTSSHEAEPV